MAAGLVGRGADRVIAMLAPVTDGYATVLARHLYQELAARPELHGRAGAGPGPVPGRGGPVPRRGQDRVPLPEYGVATLLAAGGDGPLVDPAPPPVPLTVATTPPGGQVGAGTAGGGADRPPRPAADGDGRAAPRPGGGASGSARPAGWC